MGFLRKLKAMLDSFGDKVGDGISGALSKASQAVGLSKAPANSNAGGVPAGFVPPGQEKKAAKPLEVASPGGKGPGRPDDATDVEDLVKGARPR